jgi:long-chain acyl-CoA synthetase
VNLARLLADSAAAAPVRTALWLRGEPTSYAGLEARAEAAAAALDVAPGERVAIRLPNGPDFVAALFGALRRGAIAVPLNPLLAPPEVEERLAVSTPATFVETPLSAAGGTIDLVERDESDAAVILFTSGTSGRSKGAILTHGSIRAAAANVTSALALGPEDVVLGAAPFSHVLGLSSLVATLAAGGAVAAVQRFQPDETLAEMTQTRTTILLGVPTMCIALSEAARSVEQLPPVRVGHVGGAQVPAEVARTFEQTFGAAVHEGYGMTELSGVATTTPVGRPRKPGSVGVPLGGTELRVAERDADGIGEVQLRGPSVISGYWEDPAATAEAIDSDGWLATGDMGRVDEDGYLYLVDRKKELVLRGGYNVYPREVEEALYAHPDVLEAAVIGVPHETLGEEVAALVVLRPGATTTADELQAWARARVAAYKYPRRIAVVDSLPKGPTGKILKRAIDRSALAE